MKYEIEILDELLVQGDKRYEPTGEMRLPEKGEWYLTCAGPDQASYNFESNRFIILRPVWQWPPTLGGAAFTRSDNPNSSIMWHSELPKQNCRGEWDSNGMIRSFGEVQKIHTDLHSPPPLKPGECYRNPHWKGSGT